MQRVRKPNYRGCTTPSCIPFQRLCFTVRKINAPTFEGWLRWGDCTEWCNDSTLTARCHRWPLGRTRYSQLGFSQRDRSLFRQWRQKTVLSSASERWNDIMSTMQLEQMTRPQPRQMTACKGPFDDAAVACFGVDLSDIISQFMLQTSQM